jgi:hypothetical protein
MNGDCLSEFRQAIKDGKLEEAKDLYPQLRKYINIHKNEIFLDACDRGHLEVAKWLYSLDGKIDIHADNEIAFHQVCRRGYLEVAKWLYSLDPENTNLHSNYDYVFRISCYSGNLELAKWVYSIDPQNTDIHALRDDAFWLACTYSHLEVAKWLIKIGIEPPKSDRTIRYPFYIKHHYTIYSFYIQLKQSREKYNAFLHNQTYSNTYASNIISNIVKRYV